jgi:hypothetical protein
MGAEGNAAALRGAALDLGQGDFVKIGCAACHHVALLTPEALLRAGLSTGAKVLDLKGRLRCRACGSKGRAVVSVKWRGQVGEPSVRQRLAPGWHRLALSVRAAFSSSLAAVLGSHPRRWRAQT